MRTAHRTPQAGKEGARITFWTRGAGADDGVEPSGDEAPHDGRGNGDVRPSPVPVEERFRRLPEALLLTAGYYASKAPVLGDLLRRPR